MRNTSRMLGTEPEIIVMDFPKLENAWPERYYSIIWDHNAVNFKCLLWISMSKVVDLPGVSTTATSVLQELIVS